MSYWAGWTERMTKTGLCGCFLMMMRGGVMRGGYEKILSCLMNIADEKLPLLYLVHSVSSAFSGSSTQKNVERRILVSQTMVNFLNVSNAWNIYD